MVILPACNGGVDGGGSTNTAPIAYAGPDQNVALNAIVDLDGSFSHDDDNDTLTFKWAISSSPSGALASLSSTTLDKITFTADRVGDYVVSLVVNDGTIDSAADPVTITMVSDTDDPLYGDQWHLKNTGQEGGTVGEDVNVESVWQTYTGGGVRIAIVDDGLEIGHEDLAANVAAGKSYDYVDQDTTPDSGTDAMGHGTAVAGVAAAAGFNGVGGRGAAPRTELVGYNLLQSFSSVNEADAMTRGMGENDIYSNSWGSVDSQGLLWPSSTLWQSAVLDGIATGRGGLGAIYTWAAGNGGEVFSGIATDNSNYDGQANFRGVMTIGALDDQGMKASYSEEGANLLVSAPAGENCQTHAITTTDVTDTGGFNPGGTFADYQDGNYSKCFNGTSAATPLASGIIALILEANPNLGWRDVREIIATTARKNDVLDSGWTTNGAGYNVNHKYGFGVMDAAAAVNAALTWTNVGAEVSAGYTGSPGTAIPDGLGPFEFGTMVSDAITVTGSGIQKVEFVEILFTSDHTYTGDLEITLTSPAGTESRLADNHICFSLSGISIDCGSGFSSGFTFGSTRHLGEVADGIWTISVRDGYNGDVGNLQSWGLTLHGR